MNKYVCASNSLRSGQLDRMLAKIKDSIPKEPKGERMKPTWKLIVLTSGKNSPNCKCLNCGKEFTFLGDGHFNMRLITCPTCNQQVWAPKCPNGCPSFKEEK